MVGFQWQCCILNMKIGKVCISSGGVNWSHLCCCIFEMKWRSQMKFLSQTQLKTFSWPNLKLGSHLNLVCTIYDDWVWRFWAFQLSQMNGVTQFITTKLCFLLVPHFKRYTFSPFYTRWHKKPIQPFQIAYHLNQSVGI